MIAQKMIERRGSKASKPVEYSAASIHSIAPLIYSPILPAAQKMSSEDIESPAVISRGAL